MTNDSSTERPVLRAHGVGDLLDVIPSLLGFYPAESLVAVVIDAGRVAVTARMDLPHGDGQFLALSLAPLLERFPAGDWFIAAYTCDAVAGWSALALVDAMLPGETWVRCVHVGEGLWHADPDDPGRPYDPKSGVLAAEAAYCGLPVLPDRESLVRALEPAGDPGDRDVALEAVIARPPAETVRRALKLAASGMRSDAELTLEERVVLAVAAFSPAFAETIITGIETDNAAQAKNLWTAVVRSVADGSAAAAAVILGVAAWVSGEGALLNVCLDRAAPYASDQQWFRFLELANRLALPPSEWDEVRHELLHGCGAA